MPNSQQISDLLKVAKDIPILHTGINDTTTEYSAYSVKEHNVSHQQHTPASIYGFMWRINDGIGYDLRPSS
jgi:hypothetical protein